MQYPPWQIPVLFMSAAPSPRLQRCLEAAEASGAPHEWLADHCPKPKQPLLNQIFRVLCVAGPQGCTVKGMVAKASEHGLGFGWEDNGNQRSAITSSLQHTQGGVKMAGVTGESSVAVHGICNMQFIGAERGGP